MRTETSTDTVTDQDLIEFHRDHRVIYGINYKELFHTRLACPEIQTKRGPAKFDIVKLDKLLMVIKNAKPCSCVREDYHAFTEGAVRNGIW